MLAHPLSQLAAEMLFGVFIAKVGNVGFDLAREWIRCGFTKDRHRLAVARANDHAVRQPDAVRLRGFAEFECDLVQASGQRETHLLFLSVKLPVTRTTIWLSVGRSGRI
jgi:hypothetical protein